MPLAHEKVAADAAGLATLAAEWMTASLEATTGRVAVALSGGSTPKAVYRLLAAEPLRSQVPWARAHWFFGDERFVPHDHPDSNYRMAREAFLDPVAVPRENIHPVPTDHGTPEEAAASYEAELKGFYGAGTVASDRPLFGLVLFGLGKDGHTASLFPGTAALAERTRWAVPNVAQGSDLVRVTLTFPILDSTARAAFLVGGPDKREVLAGIRSGRETGPGAQMAGMLGQRLTWLLDRDAACPDEAPR